MLETFTVDTNRIFSILRERGYTKEQADGFIEAVRELNLDQLVTKSYFKSEMDKLDLKMDKLEMKLTIKMGAFTFLLGGFLTAIKFLG
jgi:hypothetical protein